MQLLIDEHDQLIKEVEWIIAMAQKQIQKKPAGKPKEKDEDDAAELRRIIREAKKAKK